jgi:hypothetical protein
VASTRLTSRRAGGLRRQVRADQGQGHAINQQVRFFVATPTFIHIAPRRNQMSTAQEASNKATLSRFDDAMNTGDAEVISKTIDELVEPDVRRHDD